MISAKEAKQSVMQTDYSVALETCKQRTEKDIRNAISKGYTKVCYRYSCASIKGVWYDCDKDMREWLLSFGYHFEPTGYIGGVWQRTEEICW